MSESKTVIQGLEPDFAGTQVENGASSNFYQRSNRQGGKGTIVPGMTDTPNAGQTTYTQAQAQTAAPNAKASGKPIVGFLYSVSRTAVGEFWPLHIGQNTIGTNPSCDVVLPEGTVSSEHAVIVVRKLKKPEKVIASICDSRSTNGTMLNGESLGFAAVDCQNGDIITIGDNYELFLVLIDTAALGLHVSDKFIGTEVSEDAEDEILDYNGSIPPGFTKPGESFQPFGSQSSVGNSPFTPSPGTVGLDGTLGNNKGGTIGM